MSDTERKGRVGEERSCFLSSRELITALRTLPEKLYPQYFAALLESKPKNEGRTIPYSRAFFFWKKTEEGKEMFVPERFEILPPVPVRESDAQSLSRAFLKGYRFKELQYANYGPSQEPFKAFLDEVIRKRILLGSYLIEGIDLVSTTEQNGLNISAQLKKDLNNWYYRFSLNTGTELSLEERKALDAWYLTLSPKG